MSRSLALVAALLAATVAWVAAAPPASARKDRADAVARLRAAEATDAELEEAVQVLDAAARAAARKADAAARAAEQATAEAAAAERALVEQRRVVARRAVDAYAHRHAGGLRLGEDPSTAARRLALARALDARLTDAADSLRASQLDLEQRRKAATARARAAKQALDRVTQSRARAVKARADLDRRISGLQAEIAALDAEAAAVERLIRERARASVPLAPAAGPPDARRGPGGFAWPLNGRTTSEFGPRWGRMHKGLDIAAPTGTPIRASKGGVVIHAGWQGGYGNLTLVDHGGGIVTAYAHQSRMGAPRGASVRQGEVIGYVGSTGHSTGPHLHFEVRVNGVQQNPRRYLP